MSGKFFKQLWANGRVLAPANEWYEWVKDPVDPKKKQPYFITLREQTSMFFAFLAEVHGGLEPDDRDGFVIITAASDQGMIDIHDCKPLVLAPGHAKEWVDPETSPERAAEIAVEHCRLVADFRGTRLVRMWAMCGIRGLIWLSPLHHRQIAKTETGNGVQVEARPRRSLFVCRRHSAS
jgi:hypothetical protein